MSMLMPSFFLVTGGWTGYVIIAALLTLLNILVRPFLMLLTLPLRLFATLIAVILVNGIFLWLAALFAARMDPSLVTLTIDPGFWSWLLVSTFLGTANWLLKRV